MTVTEFLESVRRVEVRTNRLVNDTMGGAYLSGFTERGMNFQGLREARELSAVLAVAMVQFSYQRGKIIPAC